MTAPQNAVAPGWFGKLFAKLTGASFTGPILGPNGSGAAPSFSFVNDTDTGIYLQAAGIMNVSIAGATSWQWFSSLFFATHARGPTLDNTDGANGPTVIPRRDSLTTGLGAAAADTVSVFIAGTEKARFKSNTLNLASLPTSSSGLTAGDLWNDAGTLKVAS